MIITSPQMHEDSRPSIFIAGGISDCPDWQADVTNALVETTNLVIVNPRRVDWNRDDSVAESTKQIIWEDIHLKQAKFILFWFPEETLCPITLFELGKYLVSDKVLMIGTHPNYDRRLDVEVQTQRERPDLEVWSNLDAMLFEFIRNYRIGAY